MTELKPCPFCGGEVSFDGEWADARRYYHIFDCYECGMSVSLQHLVTEEEAIEAWNRRHPGVKVRPEPNLDGKCGSCEHSVIAVGYFGKSECYVECKNQEHLSSRNYYGRPLVAVRQRTAKGCKHYKRRAGNG